MRVVALLICILIAAPSRAQNAPGKPGLWDVSVQRTSVITPEMAERMRAHGMPILPDSTEHWHVCETADRLQKAFEAIHTVPAARASTHRSEGPNRITAGMRCDPTPAMRVEIEYDFSWTKSIRTELITRTLMSYSGAKGSAESSSKVISRFLSPDCGSIAPGEKVAVHR